jgi:hypothetical protein
VSPFGAGERRGLESIHVAQVQPRAAAFAADVDHAIAIGRNRDGGMGGESRCRRLVGRKRHVHSHHLRQRRRARREPHGRCRRGERERWRALLTEPADTAAVSCLDDFLRAAGGADGSAGEGSTSGDGGRASGWDAGTSVEIGAMKR